MTRIHRALAAAAVLTLAFAGSASAQSQCTNNLKQIGLGVHDSPVKGEFLGGAAAQNPGDLVDGPHRVLLCSDGTSNTLMLGERWAAAQVMGCPADAEGMGEARVQARERQDGSLEVMLISQQHGGCRATAAFAKAGPQAGARMVAAAVQPAGAREPDARRVSATTRQAFGSFWSGLPAREADALERRLGELEARAQRGGNVQRDLAALQAEHPQLFEAAKRLDAEPLVFVGPGGVEEGVECKGIGWIGMNGKVRCIGHLVVSD
jgi:hypothetical protein